MTSIYLTRMAIVIFLSRIFPALQNVATGTLVFLALHMLETIFLIVFVCSPISYFWNGWDGHHEGHCGDFTTPGCPCSCSFPSPLLWCRSIQLLIRVAAEKLLFEQLLKLKRGRGKQFHRYRRGHLYPHHALHTDSKAEATLEEEGCRGNNVWYGRFVSSIMLYSPRVPALSPDR